MKAALCLGLGLLWGAALVETPSQQARRDLEESARPARALKTLDEWTAAHPEDVAARVLRLRALLVLSRADEAWQAALALMDDPRGRESSEAVQYAAALALARDRPDLARPWVEVCLRGSAAGKDVVLLRLALDLAEACGDDQAARAALDAWMAADAQNPAAALRLARFHEAREDWDAAAEACEAALRIAPQDAAALEQRGQMLLRTGRRAQALAAFRQALQVDPGRRELDRYLRYLEATGRPFYADLEVPLEGLLARARPPVEGGPGYAFLLRLVAESLEDDGRVTRYVQEAIEVSSEAGAAALDVRPIVYGRGRQRVRLLAAAVHRPGAERRAAEGPREAWSEAAQGDPYDRLLVDLPPLRPGDVVDLRYTIADARPSFLGAEFSRRVAFQEDAPVREVGYVLLAGAERALRFHARGLAEGPEEQRTLEDGQILRRWTLRDLPALVAEPDMPPRHRVAPCLEISSFADWEAFGRGYARMIAPGLAASPAIEVQARSSVGDLTEPEARIEALRGFVATRIQPDERAVFDAQGLKVRPAAEILAQGGGDAQDRALLLVALLRAAGFKAWPALVDAQPLRAAADHAVALLEHFNHAVVAVEAEDGGGPARIIDPAAEQPLVAGGAVALEGARALVLADDGPRWLELPERPAEGRWVQETWDIDVEADASARAALELRVRGEYAEGLAAGDPERARAVLQRLLGVHLPGARVSELTRSESEEEGAALRLHATLSLPRCLPRELDGAGPARWPVVLYAAYHGTRLAERADLSRRAQELLLGPRSGFASTRRFDLGGRWQARELPAPRQAQTPFGRYRAAWRRDGEVLVQELEFALETRRVSAADYAAFRAFLREADAALDETVRLVPAGGGR